MNKLTLTITLAFIVGVSSPGCNEDIKKENQRTNYGFETITIDGCQYLYRDNHGYGAYNILHKGNCNNPIHLKAGFIGLNTP